MNNMTVTSTEDAYVHKPCRGLPKTRTLCDKPVKAMLALVSYKASSAPLGKTAAKDVIVDLEGKEHQGNLDVEIAEPGGDPDIPWCPECFPESLASR